MATHLNTNKTSKPLPTCEETAAHNTNYISWTLKGSDMMLVFFLVKMVRTETNNCCGLLLCILMYISLQGDLIAAFQYLKEAYKKDGDRLLSRACSNRTRGDGFKLKEGRFR